MRQRNSRGDGAFAWTKRLSMRYRHIVIVTLVLVVAVWGSASDLTFPMEAM